MQLPVLCESLDRRDRRAVDECGEVEASGHGGPIDQHRAAAAESLAAAFPRAEETEIPLEHLDDRVVRRDGRPYRAAVERELDSSFGCGHQSASSGRPSA